MHVVKFTRFAGLAAAAGAAAVLASCESEVPLTALTAVPELGQVVDPANAGKFEVCKVGDTATFEVKVDGVLEQTIELADGECVIVHENTTDEALLVEVREVPAEGLDSIVVVTLLQKPGGGYGTIVQTFPGDQHDNVKRYISSKKGAKATFFNRPPECTGQIGDFVWNDEGGTKGIQDVGEPGLEGVVVRLKDADGEVIATTTTDADGMYLFTGLCAGTYTVEVDESTVPEGWMQTETGVGTDPKIDNNPNPSTVVLEKDDSEDLTIDFGYMEPVEEEPCQECKGGIIELTLRNNGPAGVIRIEGDVDFEQFVESGAEFTFTGTGKNGKMKKDIKIFLDEEEVEKIHTSCSKPIGPGAVFGDFEVVRAVSKDNGVVCPIGEGEDCDDGKPQVLVVLYSGEDCDASSNTQADDKVSCEGDPASTDPVFIRVSDKEKPDDKKAKVWFEGIVALNGTFDIDATNADEDKLKANTWVVISDEEGGTVLQTVQFHTSCSQPLNEGDQFGSLLLIDFIPEP